MAQFEIFTSRNFNNNYSRSKRNVVLISIILRNRKHFPCFQQVIGTGVAVWENNKCCGHTSVSMAFLSSPKPSQVLTQIIETQRKCFLLLLENSPRKIMENEEKLIVLFIIKT